MEGDGVIFSSTTGPIFAQTRGTWPQGTVLKGVPCTGDSITISIVVPGTTIPAVVSTFSVNIGGITTPGGTEMTVYDTAGQVLGNVVANSTGRVVLTANFQGESSFDIHTVVTGDPDDYGWNIGSVSYQGSAAGWPTTLTSSEFAAAVGGGDGSHNGTTCTNPDTGTPTDPVNCASGDFSESATDAQMAPGGSGSVLSRTYNSLLDSTDGAFGYGWTWSYDMNVELNPPGTVTVTEADGTQVTTLTDNGTSTGSLILPSFTDSTLTHNADGTWTLVRDQKTTYTFDASGKLASVADLAGNTDNLSYNGTGQLTEVASVGGQSVTIDYGSGGLISQVSGPSGLTTHYAYTTGNLVEVTSPSGVTRYSYSGHLLTGVTADDGAATTNVYDTQGQVTSQTDPYGGTTTFSYAGDNFSTAGGTTTISHPDGDVEVEHYVAGKLLKITEGVGTTTSFASTVTYTATTWGTTNSTQGGRTISATYDTQGNAVTSTGADDNTTDYAYTTSSDGVPAGLRFCTVSPGEVTRGVTCPAYGATRTGAATETFDAAGNTITSRDAKGNTTDYAYTTSSDGVPAGLRYCTVSPGEVDKGVTCPAYGSTQSGAAIQTFDALGNEISSTTATGATTTSTYGDTTYPSLPTKITGPSGTTTTNTYDAAGHLTKQVVAYHGYSATTAYFYDADGHQVCRVSPGDYADGVRCPTGTPTPASPPTGVTSTFYDGGGQATKTVGPTGATTLSTYDPSGQVYCTVAPPAAAQGVTCPAFTGLVTPTAGDDPYVGATIEVYNALGEQTTQASPLGAVTIDIYDTEDQATSQTVASGTSAAPSVTTTTSYDPNGNPTATTTGNQTTDTGYDPTGTAYCTVSGDAEASGATCPAWEASWLTAPPAPSSVPVGVTLTVTDATGNPAQQTSPDGGTTVTAYDATGNPFCTVKPIEVADGVTCPSSPPTSPPTGTNTGYTTTLYNATGKVTSVTNATGTSTTTTYDASGLKHIVTKGRSTTTYCHYGDSCASGAPSDGGTATDLYSTTRPPSQKDPTGEVTTETYTPTGKPTTTTTPAVTTTDIYDAAGDVTGVSYSTVASGYTAPSDVTSTYNPTGTVVSTATATGTTTDTYDEAGDLTSQSFAPATGSNLTASSVGYAYTPTGKTKSITYPSYGGTSDPTATYTYTATGTMGTVSDWLGHTTSFSFDKSGDLTSTTFPNSTTDAQTFDTTGEVTGISLSPTGHSTAPLATIGYTRNATEYVTKETDTGALSASPSYSYDETGRLSTSTGSGVGYTTATEPGTLPTGASASYDTAGELTSSVKGSTTTTYSYDSIGARTKVDPTTGPTTTYGVNALGQMTSATSTATTGPLSGTGVGFTVNGQGLRVGETTSSGTQTFTWDTTSSVPRVLTDGTTAFICGPTGEVVEQVDLSTTAPTYLVADQLGSTRLLTDQAGTVVGTYSYDAYGNQTSHTGTATSPIGYAGGGWATGATGLVYLVNRYYTQETGSFLSVDPLVATTTQPYVYTSNDPVNGTDPTGDVPACGYEPKKCGSQTTMSLSQKIQFAMTFFVGRGLTPIQASGLVGNLQFESGGTLDPYQIQTGCSLPPGPCGVGIGQWTDPGYRWNALGTYAQVEFRSPYSYTTQVGFTWFELTVGTFTSALASLRQQTTVYGATTVVMTQYEKPGIPHFNYRLTDATHIYQKYGRSLSTGTPTTTTTASVLSGCPTGVEAL
jgi:RHS repeat-associated protein